MKVEQISPRTVTIKLTQETTDSDYGSCLWAVFQLDLDAYRMQIMSDCGNYAYGWFPTPDSESFLHLLARIGEEYLLCKISSPSVVDAEATYKSVKEYLDGENETEKYSDYLIRSACQTRSPRDCLDALREALEGTSYSDTADLFELASCIETDYPAGAKRIASLFRVYIRPLVRELDKETK